ncbi:hypothetical protein AGMMS4952_09420 [Spirochaetia bacterium]|nr:hypothetical protein AGMMS4952_09420 [Spirochaetia bacterium]
MRNAWQIVVKTSKVLYIIADNRLRDSIGVDMLLLNTQLVFFFDRDYSGEFESLSISLKAVFENSTSTMLIPIDTSAPSEIPRLTISFNGYAINVSKNRIDITINGPNIDTNIIERLNAFDFSSLNINVKRIGYVCTYFFEDNPNRILNEVFSEQYRSNDYTELNIRLNKPFSSNGKQCNNIESVSPGKINGFLDGNQLSKNGLIVQRDVNTSANEVIPIIFDMRRTFIADFSEKCTQFIFHYEG